MTLTPQHISEEELVSRLLARDKSAFVYLYDQYSAALNGIISRIVSEPAMAEEVLHDAFLKIWNNIYQYESGKGRLFTWMYRLCRNLALDKLRSSEFKKMGKTDSLADNVNAVNQSYNLQQSVDGIGLEKLLANLSPEQRLIIDLVYFKGYTQSEIAKEYDIPLGTVKTRHRLAMLHLRKIAN